jgi:hypothetical protein
MQPKVKLTGNVVHDPPRGMRQQSIGKQGTGDSPARKVELGPRKTNTTVLVGQDFGNTWTTG